MNEQCTRQAQDMFKAAQDSRIPESLQAMAEDGVSKTREAYQKLQTITKDNAKVYRVVAGPYKDSEISLAKKDLQAKGYKGAFLAK